MGLLARNPGLEEAMEEYSALERTGAGDARAYDLIVRRLSEVLEPGERVIAYAERRAGDPGGEIDILPSDAGSGAGRSDVLGYRPGGPERETDVLPAEPHGDRPLDRAGTDVLGYVPGGPANETDVFAHDHPADNIETDIFMRSGPARLPDIDFLLLSERRLIRGILHDEKVSLMESADREPEVEVAGAASVAIRLPQALRRDGEDERWSWNPPRQLDARAVARRWRP